MTEKDLLNIIQKLDSALVMYLDAEDMGSKYTCDKNTIKILNEVRTKIEEM